MRILHFLVLLLSFFCGLSTQISMGDIEPLVNKFKLNLNYHIDEVLAFEHIKQMLEKHEGDLVISPINGPEIFENLYQSISIKYSDVILAVKKLKRAFEANTNSSTESMVPPPSMGGGPPIVPPSMKCCCTLRPGKFDGKVRDSVHDEECYGNQDKILESISRTNFKDAMKVGLVIPNFNLMFKIFMYFIMTIQVHILILFFFHA